MNSVSNNIKLYHNTHDKNIVFDLTVSFSLSEMKNKILGKSRLVTLSTMKTFSAVQEPVTNCSMFETKHTVMKIRLLRSRAPLSNCSRTRTHLVSQERLQFLRHES